MLSRVEFRCSVGMTLVIENTMLMPMRGSDSEVLCSSRPYPTFWLRSTNDGQGSTGPLFSRDLMIETHGDEQACY